MRVIDESGRPMMSDLEIMIINDLLRDKQCKRCLEWGSGNSTVYFPKENPFIEEWIAIEHNKTYYELLNDKLGKGVSIVLPKNYVSYPKELGKKFDFIFIDGENRDACVDMSFEIINKDGVILMHDAGRIESKNILEKYKGKYDKLCEGEQMTSNGYYAHRGLVSFHHD